MNEGNEESQQVSAVQDAGSSLEGNADVPAPGVRAPPSVHERAALASADEGMLALSGSVHCLTPRREPMEN